MALHEPRIDHAANSVFASAVLRKRRRFDVLMRELDALEVKIESRRAPARDRLRGKIDIVRLRIVIFRNAPPANYVHIARRIVDAPIGSTSVLGIIGAFAVHCGDHHQANAAVSILAAALKRARRDRVNPHMISVFEEHLASLQMA